MTRRFWDDPYLTELDTTVDSVNGRDVTVADTIMFAASGGQESDSGTIAGIPVTEARYEGQSIVYTLERDHDLRPGDAVRMSIDWSRRYALMRLHMAAEIVLVLVMKTIPGVQRIGAHISETKARLDFALEQPITPLLPAIESEANRLVSADLPVRSEFSDREAERRFWEIDGFGSLPCAGTHIRTTGEIGSIVLSRKNPGRGKERIEIAVGG